METNISGGRWAAEWWGETRTAEEEEVVCSWRAVKSKEMGKGGASNILLDVEIIFVQKIRKIYTSFKVSRLGFSSLSSKESEPPQGSLGFRIPETQPPGRPEFPPCPLLSGLGRAGKSPQWSKRLLSSSSASREPPIDDLYGVRVSWGPVWFRG